MRASSAGSRARLALVAPTGTSWQLPMYELAMLDLIAPGRARSRGGRALDRDPRSGTARDVRRGREPDAAQPARRPRHPPADRRRDDELRGRTSASERRACAGRRRGDRASPPARPKHRGLPSDGEGFIPVDEHCQVEGVHDVFAAGDGTNGPFKQGGLATQQADAAAEAIAARLGDAIEPAPFEPLLRGMLLTGLAPMYMRSGAGGELPRCARGSRRERAVVAADEDRRPLPRPLPRLRELPEETRPPRGPSGRAQGRRALFSMIPTAKPANWRWCSPRRARWMPLAGVRAGHLESASSRAGDGRPHRRGQDPRRRRPRRSSRSPTASRRTVASPRHARPRAGGLAAQAEMDVNPHWRRVGSTGRRRRPGTSGVVAPTDSGSLGLPLRVAGEPEARETPAIATSRRPACASIERHPRPEQEEPCPTTHLERRPGWNCPRPTPTPPQRSMATCWAGARPSRAPPRPAATACSSPTARTSPASWATCRRASRPHGRPT